MLVVSNEEVSCEFEKLKKKVELGVEGYEQAAQKLLVKMYKSFPDSDGESERCFSVLDSNPVALMSRKLLEGLLILINKIVVYINCNPDDSRQKQHTKLLNNLKKLFTKAALTLPFASKVALFEFQGKLFDTLEHFHEFTSDDGIKSRLFSDKIDLSSRLCEFSKHTSSDELVVAACMSPYQSLHVIIHMSLINNDAMKNMTLLFEHLLPMLTLKFKDGKNAFMVICMAIISNGNKQKTTNKPLTTDNNKRIFQFVKPDRKSVV